MSKMGSKMASTNAEQMDAAGENEELTDRKPALLKTCSQMLFFRDGSNAITKRGPKWTACTRTTGSRDIQAFS